LTWAEPTESSIYNNRMSRQSSVSEQQQSPSSTSTTPQPQPQPSLEWLREMQAQQDKNIRDVQAVRKTVLRIINKLKADSQRQSVITIESSSASA
jgi:hypothetical protein